MAAAIRTASRDDLAAVVAMLNAADVATLGSPDTTEEDISSGWDESGFDVTADAFVAEDGGEIVAYGEVYDRGEEGQLDIDVVPHPDAPLDVAAAMLDTVLARAGERAEPGTRLATWLPVGAPRRPVFTAAGFEALRQFSRMRLEHDGDLPDPRPPDGVTLRPFVRTADEVAVHRILVDAFSHHARPLTPSLERFAEQHMTHPDFDESLWGVAVEGDEIVGAITVFDHGDIGFIPHIGVPEDRRGRGIASALVHQALRLLEERGQRSVHLGVDLEDEVGAARLYEHLGFRTIQTYELMERRL